MNRRKFLVNSALLSGSLLLESSARAPKPGTKVRRRSNSISVAKEYGADIVVVGGGMGGCAAALAACRNGLSVVMTEETDWIWGQLSQQGVPPDDHKWIETQWAPAS